MALLNRTTIFAFLLSMALPVGLQAAALPGSAELLLKADKLTQEQTDNIIKATGNVELTWSAAKLYADMATYYGAEDLLTAEGKVRLEKEGDTVTGDSARFKITARTGVIENGRIFVKEDNLHVRGRELEKTGDKEYLIRDGSITTCDGEKPGWKFKVDELDVTLDDFATGRNAFFYLGDIPVFWFPYLVFPVKTEKQSGFLLPQIGHSTIKGFFLETPYYWDISPSKDATFTLDLQSARGAGAALEYRYKSLNSGQGLNRGYLIYDTTQARFRGNLDLQQQINFSADTYWRADIGLTLDRNFFRDYGTQNGEYNRQYVGATAFLSHRQDDTLLTGGVDYLDNLDIYNSVGNKATLQKLPFLTLLGTGSRIGATPLYYSFNSAATLFDRDVGSRGERFLLEPQLMLQQAISPGVAGRLWVGYNQRFYNAVGAATAPVLNTAPVSGIISTQAFSNIPIATAADGWHGIGLFEGGGNVQAEFDRTFDVDFGSMTRLRHQIVPELGYEIRQRSDQSRIPFYDYDDRPVGGQMLTASVHNYITGKSVLGGVTNYRDLVNVTLSQSYQLSGERRDLLVLVDEGRRFADTQLKAEITPLSSVTIQSDNRISPYTGNLTNASLGIEAGEPKGNRLGFSWHHAKGLLDYLEGRVTLIELQPFTLTAMSRYSFDRPGFLEKLFSVEYKQQCWSLLFSYRDRLDNKEFTINFNLSGLGTFKLL